MLNPIDNLQIHAKSNVIEVTWDLLTKKDKFLWRHDHLEVRITPKPSLKLGKPSTGSSLDEVQVSTSTSQSGGVSAGIPGVIDLGRDTGKEEGTSRPAIEWGKQGATHWANIPTKL